MSLINKEATIEKCKRCHFTKAVVELLERQEEIICECDLAENAATICAVLDADSEGRVWKIADAVPVRHARWEKNGEYIVCSNCRTLRKLYRSFKTAYCPDCGAKMDGKDDAE